MKNILFLTVDSLRADYVFGPKAPDSLETLPRLAEKGIQFTNGFSNAAYTKQSFRSIFSGTYPWMFDSEEGGYGLDRPHIAELLSEGGYTTGGFHTNVYLSPTYNYMRGFDHYFGRDSGSSDDSRSGIGTSYGKLVERAVSSRQMSDIAHTLYKYAGMYLGVQLGDRLYKTAEELNDAVINWTRQCSRPTFAWVHYMDVHNPYYPHDGTVSEGISRRKAIKLFHRVTEKGTDASPEDIQTLERLYRGEIEQLDTQLGDLLERVDQTLGLDSTVIVFTSDHGEAFNEHGNVFHPGSALHDENVHVPIIVHGPDIGSGEVHTPVSNLDIVPTLLSNVGIEVPESVVGDDVTKLATTPRENRLVFAEAYSPEEGNVMVTDGRFKLIRNLETGEESLYDRYGEQTEVHDPAGEYSNVRNELGAEIDEHIRMVNRFEGRSDDIEVTEDVRLQLRKLGYE